MRAALKRALRKGPRAAASALWRRLARPIHMLRVRGGTEYPEPTAADLLEVEAGLRAIGIPCHDYAVDPSAFASFKATLRFPADYHGGDHGSVYEEKLLEHFVAWDLLGLGTGHARTPYVDVAGASSPWARLLRQRGVEAFSIDLQPDPSVAHLEYYLAGDATASPFAVASIGAASLQCAYEMFAGDADTRLVNEFARILAPGGRAVIAPLYMHTHACYYQSPEHYRRVSGDPGATAYVRRSAWSVPASRKYSPDTLKRRVIEPARDVGLEPRVHVLRNKASLGRGIYLHFLMTLDKPADGERRP